MFKKLTIKKKITFIITLLIVFNVISYSYITMKSNQIADNNKVANVVGRNRFLSQKISGLAIASLDDDKNISKAFKEELVKTQNLFIKNLNVLINGGIAPSLTPGKVSTLKIDAANEKNLPNLLALKKYYNSLNKECLSPIITKPSFVQGKINPELVQAEKVVLDNLKNSIFLNKAQKVIDSYTKHFEEIQANFILVLIFVIVLNFILIYFIYYVVNNYLSKPLNEVQVISDVIAQGDFSKTIHYNNTDEIGQISNSINSLVNNMSIASEFADAIGNNQLDVEFNSLGKDDILGNSLITMRRNLVDVADKEKKRNWATEGLAKFGEILRMNNEGLKGLADNIISNLVRYLNANQGGLFIVNDTNPKDAHLELIACYAWNKKKYLHMRIEQGEGLVGQAWQENDTLYITDVPADFVKITSGLGDANPNAFLIIPLKINDETYGVIEIASFHPFEEYQIEFVNKLAESIASTISTAKINERTKQLLEQSQQQAEEMRAQEEEMRQNMEEMQATQEEMERKESEMGRMMEQMQQQEEEMRQNMEEMAATQEEMEKQNAVIAEKAAESQGILEGINASMATIEFTPDGYVKDANTNFLKTMKVSLEEIIGKHHSNFVPEDIKKSAEYQRLWSDLASGIEKQDVVKRINKLGETVWLNAIYNPIKNASGEVIKVIKFATDITEQKEQEAELNAKMSGVNATMATIEFTPEGIVLDANENFLHTMKYTLADIKGKHHKNFVTTTTANSSEYQSFWIDLANGKPNQGIFERVNSLGEIVVLNAIYNPIKNADGKVTKVIKFATDITNRK